MIKCVNPCKLCLQKRPLVKSHAFPRSFFGEDNVLIEENSLYPKRRPIGPYDKNILCEECENDLNKGFDDYAKVTLIDKKDLIHEIINNSYGSGSVSFYRLANKDGYDQISRFLISVLWRASVAFQNDFENVSLGPYESIARQIILDKNYDFKKYFLVALFYFPNFNGKINLISKPTRIESLNFYIFMMGTIKVYIKCDKRPFPSWGMPLTLSKENNILMLENDLRDHPEHKILLKSAQKFMKYK
jgi:hypothetical protein